MWLCTVYAQAESPTGLDGYIWLDVNDEPSAIPGPRDDPGMDALGECHQPGEGRARDCRGGEARTRARGHSIPRCVSDSRRDRTEVSAAGYRAGRGRSTGMPRSSRVRPTQLSELLGIGRVPPVVERSDRWAERYGADLDGRHPSRGRADPRRPAASARRIEVECSRSRSCIVFDNLICQLRPQPGEPADRPQLEYLVHRSHPRLQTVIDTHLSRQADSL